MKIIYDIIEEASEVCKLILSELKENTSLNYVDSLYHFLDTDDDADVREIVSYFFQDYKKPSKQNVVIYFITRSNIPQNTQY